MAGIITTTSLLLLSIIIFLTTTTTTTAQKFYDFRCSDNYTQSTTYQSNLNQLLQNITSQSYLTLYSVSSIGTSSNTVYSGYVCRGDIHTNLCGKCVANATKTITQTCPDQIAGVIWYDICQFGFSPAPFTDQYMDVYRIAIRSNDKVKGNWTQFANIRNTTLKTVVKMAANDTRKNLMFGTREGNVTSDEKIYSLAQCAPYLSKNTCTVCLDECIEMLPQCCKGRNGGRVMFPACNIRYEITPFYYLANESIGGRVSGGEKNRWYIWVVVSISVVVVLFAAICVVITIINGKKNELLASNNVDMNEITSAESLQYDFNSIKAATHNFSSDNMLGQGGFGAVYKGKLENGQDIAVKRLSETSGQGGSEFKTEVLLVAKLQHRNLVKLLGFCLSGKEKILVYEYLHNSSLDRFLSDPVKRASLDWSTRYKIICGIAKGLLYLHEDSRLKIIHRDLKSSNILLDEDMNPKISDFGLAKLFGVDQTQDDTNRIVGTYGYMAPEYVLTGHYSVKSDVYSFGIIVLEILSGQKNRFFNRSEDEEALLFRAWKLWSDGEAVDLADPSLNGNYSTEELIRCVQLGLMCIQESALRRPKMTIVVAALNGQSIALPDPTPPNFFSSSAPVSSTTNTMTAANLTSTSSTTTRTTTTSEYSDTKAINRLEDVSDYSGFEDITECHPR